MYFRFRFTLSLVRQHHACLFSTSSRTAYTKKLTTRSTKKIMPLPPPPPPPMIFQRCAGMRKRDGQPCQRRVPVDPSSVSTSILAYCHNHRPPLDKEAYVTTLNSQTKRTIKSSPIYDCWLRKVPSPFLTMDLSNLFDLFFFLVWIGKHIGSRKRQQLLQEMVKPISPKDEAGYLYAYRLASGPRVSTAKFCYFKIGRSTNPTRRMGSVIKRCQHNPQLLDILPATQRTTKSPTSSLVKCPLSHRVERLIHIELSAMYPSTGSFKCDGCGTEHREWFRVARPWVGTRMMTDQEVWTHKIRPVVLHWMKYGVAASAILQGSVGVNSS